MTTAYTRNFGLAMPDFRTGPWHDLVNNDFAKIDQLLFGAVSQTDVHPWVNATAYTAGVTVLDPADASSWMCSVSHTSAATGTFAADRALRPTYWVRLLNGFAPRGEWAYNTHYFPYDLVYQTNQGVLALCITEHVSRVSGNIIDDKVYWSFLVDFHNIGLSTALAVTYSNTTSGLTGVNVQAAVDEVAARTVALNNVNITQGTNITNLQNKDVTHEARMTAIETTNTNQDTSIAAVQAQANATNTAKYNKTGGTLTGDVVIDKALPKLTYKGATKSLISYNDDTYFYLIPWDNAAATGTPRPIRINMATGGLELCQTGEALVAGGSLWVQTDLQVHRNLQVDGGANVVGNFGVSGSSNLAGGAFVGNTLTVANVITSNAGYRCRKGTSGPQGANTYNLFWNGSAMEVYVEDVIASSVVCDPRVKKNVTPLKVNATQTLKQIRPVNFYYKDISIYRDDGKNHIGFLADNLADVLPESVKGIPNAVNSDGEIQPVGVDTTAIIAMLVKAVQELSGRVDNLERVSHTK